VRVDKAPGNDGFLSYRAAPPQRYVGQTRRQIQPSRYLSAASSSSVSASMRWAAASSRQITARSSDCPRSIAAARASLRPSISPRRLSIRCCASASLSAMTRAAIRSSLLSPTWPNRFFSRVTSSSSIWASSIRCCSSPSSQTIVYGRSFTLTTTCGIAFTFQHLSVGVPLIPFEYGPDVAHRGVEPRRDLAVGGGERADPRLQPLDLFGEPGAVVPERLRLTAIVVVALTGVARPRDRGLEPLHGGVEPGQRRLEFRPLRHCRVGPADQCAAPAALVLSPGHRRASNASKD